MTTRTEGDKTASEMMPPSPFSARPAWRFLLAVVLGLALASRLAVGATAPGSSDALARLQAATVLCAPGQGHAPPPVVPHSVQWDDLLVFAEDDAAHALLAAPLSIPKTTGRWMAVVFAENHCAPPPAPWRAAWNARGPPAV